MKAKPLPPLDYLNECFELSDESPSGLIWKVRPRYHFVANAAQWNGRHAGKMAGCIKTTPTKRRCWLVSLNSSSRYAVHRIIYSMAHGAILPVDIEIDHIDTDALNNKHLNLRLASHSDNAQNTSFRRDNVSGFKGVGWSTTGKYWWGEVVLNGHRYRVKGYMTAESCGLALRELRESLHKEFCNHG